MNHTTNYRTQDWPVPATGGRAGRPVHRATLTDLLGRVRGGRAARRSGGTAAEEVTSWDPTV